MDLFWSPSVFSTMISPTKFRVSIMRLLSRGKLPKSLQQEDELETNCRAMIQTSKPKHRIMRNEFMQWSFKNHIRQ